MKLTRRDFAKLSAMAGVGLGTSITGLRSIGVKPLLLGLVSALTVGVISAALVTLFY